MSENNCCYASGECCEKPPIQTVSTQLLFKDRLGGWKVRWGIGRTNYTVEPGVYKIGKPDEKAPVLVSANYKLTFDFLRKELTGVNCWLLILDTKGINVWCAAGKGSFGTEELIEKIRETHMAEIVSRRELILPQLGAPGINGSEIKKQTEFSVIYGTIRAQDIKAFLDAGNKATEEMRTVKFDFKDRIVLTPMEVVLATQKLIVFFGILFLLNLVATKPFGVIDFVAYVGATIAGTFITPILLPLIPGKAFALKGAIIGVFWAMGVMWFSGWIESEQWFLAMGYLLVLPSISAYFAMNFTGSSTYTSPSGVLKEMKIALPFMIVAFVVGGILILLSRIFGI